MSAAFNAEKISREPPHVHLLTGGSGDTAALHSGASVHLNSA
jgi:hypothetical protein